MNEIRDRNWWAARREALDPIWCETHTDVTRLWSPQGRWFELGQKFAAFVQAARSLGGLLSRWKPNARCSEAMRDTLLSLVGELMWTGEYLVLMCPGLENAKSCYAFLTGTAPQEYMERKATSDEPFRRFLVEFGESCSDFMQGVTEYVEDHNKVLDIPELPWVSQIVDVRPHLFEARDLLSLGYVHSALFVLSRSIESVFRGMVVSHHQLMGAPDISKVKTFDEHIRLLSSTAYQGIDGPILVPAMRGVLDAVRQYRNMVVHDDGLSEEFLATASPRLAELAVNLLVRLDQRLGKLDGLSIDGEKVTER